MKVSLDQQLVGQADSGMALGELLGADMLETIVCARIDDEDLDLSDLLAMGDLPSSELQLFSFDGWIDEAAQQVKGRLDALPDRARALVVIGDGPSPIDAVDGVTKKPQDILAELVGIKQHLDADLGAMIDEVRVLFGAAETTMTRAIRSGNVVAVADALRLEWSLALRALLSFLDPDKTMTMPPCEPGPELGPEALFEANLEAMADYNPLLISTVRSAWDNRDEDRYGWIQGPSGLRSPLVNGHQLWSVMEPRRDVEWIAEHYKADVAEGVTERSRWDSAVSWGLPGDAVFDYLEATQPGRPKLLARPDLAAFAAELHCVDWRGIFGQDNTVIPTTVEEYRWTLRSCFVYKDMVRRLTSPNMLVVDPTLYKELHEESGHTLLSMTMENYTGVSRGRQWTRNALTNAAVVVGEPDAYDLKDLRKGVPGLLVAPGPSLRKNMHLIPKFAEFGVVVGVSHVLGKLQRLGIDPELTVAIEGNDISSHFKDTEVEKTAIFVHESTHPNVVNQPAAQRWIVHDCSVADRLRPDVHLKPMSMLASSCTHVALWALKELGCDPIVFVGLDLALEDGKQYSDGCEGWTPSQSNLTVEGYHGGTVETLAQYNTFRDQFELSLAHEQFAGRRYVNATEGGAKIRGIEQLTLQEFIDEMADREPKAERGALMAPEAAVPKIDWAEIAARFDSWVEDTNEAKQSAVEAIKKTRQAIDAFKAGKESAVTRRGRAAARKAVRANQVLTEDNILNGRWMAAQNSRSARHERQADYLKDDPKALLRHNLAHYQQLLAAIEEAAGSLSKEYEAAAQRVREIHHV